MAEARVVPSVCPLDCPDRCSLDVEVDGDRVVRIDGSRRNPLTDGYICGKVRKFTARVHGPERIANPAVRMGPKGPGARFAPVSWDEAIGLVAERLRAVAARDGWEAVLPYWYGGSNGWLTGGGYDVRLWNHLGTSRVERTLCAANTGAATRAVYGAMPSADPLEVDRAELVIVWGCNPSASGIHLVPRLRAVQERGGTLIVVDPRRTPLAKHADLHVAPLPGTDVALALAVAHLAIRRGHLDPQLAAHCADLAAFADAAAEWTPEKAAEVCGIPAEVVVALADRYAAADRALIRVGWGLERTRNGTDAVRAVLALPAIYGKLGRPGAGWVLSTSGGYGIDSSAWQGTSAARAVNGSRLGWALNELSAPPIRALFVYDCNPVATVPDQHAVIRGLLREDLFTVVHEQVRTDTVDYADVVLPATTFLEHHEITKSYGGYLLQWAEPVIPPVGEARSNHQVLRALAGALGVDGEPSLAVDELALAAEIAGHARVDLADLRRERMIPVHPAPQEVRGPIRLAQPAPPRFRPPPVDADRPLIVVSPASTRAISSTGFEHQRPGTAVASLHPDDAAARGIRAGHRVRLENSVGALEIRAELDPDVRRGVVSVPKGLWRRGTLDGFTANAVVPGHVDEIGGGACYNDARVDVIRCS